MVYFGYVCLSEIFGREQCHEYCFGMTGRPEKNLLKLGQMVYLSPLLEIGGC